MYLKIHFGNKPVFLCDERTPDIEEILHHPDAIYLDELSSQGIKSMLHEIKKPEFHAGIYQDSNLENLKKAFWKHFTIIQAAGGLVRNKRNESLFIYRRGHWDLPKGKLDPGETLPECALREVREETAIHAITAGPLICVTYHTYEEYGKNILKESYWYAMKTEADEIPVPQTEEDITEIAWLSDEKMESILPLAYPSIREVMAKAGVN